MTQRTPRSFMQTLLLTGLVVGLLDGTAASIQYVAKTGNTPDRVFSYIAGALFAPGTFGPATTVVVGSLMHLSIAMGWTTLFFFVARRVALLRGQPLVVGPLYGLFVWAMMNRVLVPLTHIGPPKTFNLSSAAQAAAILVVCIGIPVAFGFRTLTRDGSEALAT